MLDLIDKWITSDITIIGRNKHAADLFLDSKTTTGLISRMHARIIRNQKDGKEQYELCDTSLNGTYVNDIKVSGTVVLNNGDTIAFGHIKGAILEPGSFAPQKDSEFLYKFEKTHYTTPPKTKKAPTGCALPLYADVHNTEVPNSSSLIKSTKNSGKRSLSNCFKLKEFGSIIKTPSDAELKSLVTAVVSKADEESDEEFSLLTTPLRPSTCTESSTLGTIGALSERHVTTTPKLNENGQEKVTGAKKRKQNLLKENRKRYYCMEEMQYSHDMCASTDCCHPTNQKNTWVQCDDCDKWFHLKCTGLTNKDVSNDSTLFHCGCS
ncbi:transcription factor 19-like isoform X2 [Rhopilema esculentum]|uniref:transcription factor 19-like isoform X2 n=1 Tax=Rhopilema esculentum TaxID=499914 RepID=UPI0031E2CA9C